MSSGGLTKTNIGPTYFEFNSYHKTKQKRKKGMREGGRNPIYLTRRGRPELLLLVPLPANAHVHVRKREMEREIYKERQRDMAIIEAIDTSEGGQ